MRGDLDVAMELYRQGEQAAAVPHVEHALDARYEALEHAFEERGAAAFEEPLEALEEMIEDGAPLDRVEAGHQAVLQAIAAAEAGVPGAAPSTRFAVVIELVRAAAGEYAEAVGEGGEVVEAVEYQEALGFARAARGTLDAIPTDGAPAVAEAVAKAQAQLDQARRLWPSTVPPATVEGDASVLYGAAANIEIAGLKLE